MQWPAGRMDVIGLVPMRFTGNIGVLSDVPRAGTRFNVNTGETYSPLSAQPTGYYAGGAYALPYAIGLIAGTSLPAITGTGNAAAGVNIEGATSATLATDTTLTALANLLGASSLASASAATLTALATMTGAVSVTSTTSGAITARAFMVGVVPLNLSTVGAVTGIASLAGSAVLVATASGNIRAIAGLSGVASCSITTAALLDGVADLSGNAAVNITATGSIGGIATVSGSSALAVTASAQTGALGFMTAAPIDTALTPNSIADAVWAKLGLNGQTYGATMTSAEKWAKLSAALSA